MAHVAEDDCTYVMPVSFLATLWAKYQGEADYQWTRFSPSHRVIHDCHDRGIGHDHHCPKTRFP